jgi:hypothetical protein
MTVFDRLRAACATVVGQAKHVRLEHTRIRPFALSLPLAGAGAPEFDARHHFVGDPEATAAYVLMLDTVNFGSGYFPKLQKRAGLSGYYTVASSLKDLFEARGAPEAAELGEMTAEDCARIFGQDLGDEARSELMGLFAQALRELGTYLQSDFGGSPARLALAAEGSAERLVALLCEMPMFRDVAAYQGLELPFLKRAQITVTDLSLAFNGGSTRTSTASRPGLTRSAGHLVTLDSSGGSVTLPCSTRTSGGPVALPCGLGYFRDLDKLTVFADNLVPHVLRVDGLLHYDEALAGRIEAGELVEPGSSEEIEIRAAAVHAVELMTVVLKSAGHQVSARDLDYLLWNRGQGEIYKQRPRHRTRTVCY